MHKKLCELNAANRESMLADQERAKAGWGDAKPAIDPLLLKMLIKQPSVEKKLKRWLLVSIP